jgi:hypothetical protein
MPYFFKQLPKIISLPRAHVRWHYNSLCRGCPFELEDNERAVAEKRLGAIPHISIQDAVAIEQLLNVSRTQTASAPVTDIEDLHQLFGNPREFDRIEYDYPTTVKRAKRILGVPVKRIEHGSKSSPLVEAARTQKPQVSTSTAY